MEDLFRVSFMEMRSLGESSELSASDEPYVIFCAMNVAGIPAITVQRTKVFNGTDQGDLDKDPTRIWGVNGKAAPIADPNKVIMLVGVIENDGCDPEVVVTLCRAIMAGNLLAFVSAGFPHNELVDKLLGAFKSALDLGCSLAANGDDIVGLVKELKLTKAILAAAKKGTQRLDLNFGDLKHSSGKYRLGFNVAAGSGN